MSTPPCCVCGSRRAAIVTEAQNALPAGVAICVRCRRAIGRRDVGIVRRADGTLHVTDGRPRRRRVA